MTITANDKIRLETYGAAQIRAYRIMWEALCEGGLGVSFRELHHVSPQLGRFVVEHAMTTYWTNRAKWDGLGHFITNYNKTVVSVAEGVSASIWWQMVPNDYYLLIWEVWAKMCQKFADGTDALGLDK
jgi:hypothetical protein